MHNKVFLPADILIPENADMQKWSVIACDQFSSEPEYWRDVERFVGDEPSTLRLMIPEAYLGTDKEDEPSVSNAMKSYLSDGMFTQIPCTYVYTERQLSVGNIRRGLIGMLELDAYDYREDSRSLVHSTEGTVEDRLPPRVRVREAADLEIPHVVIFIDDPECQVIDPIMYSIGEPEMLYDFDLMLGGGHITGWRVSGEKAACVENALWKLADEDVLIKKYGPAASRSPVVFAVGDGNHSLAAAKLCWENVKASLSPEQAQNHPARFALVELVNLHDSSIVFEPIHRVLFDTDTVGFMREARDWFSRPASGDGEPHSLKIITGGDSETITVRGLNMCSLISGVEEFCESYIRRHAGSLDYIHGDDTAAGLACRPSAAGILLPAMHKSELFPSIIANGAFPRKSFSIGHARDKRYYLECRKIK